MWKLQGLFTGYYSADLRIGLEFEEKEVETNTRKNKNMRCGWTWKEKRVKQWSTRKDEKTCWVCHSAVTTRRLPFSHPCSRWVQKCVSVSVWVFMPQCHTFTVHSSCIHGGACLFMCFKGECQIAAESTCVVTQGGEICTDPRQRGVNIKMDEFNNV